MKTVEQKLREAKKSVEGLLPTRHGEGAGMTASGERLAIAEQLAAFDRHVKASLKSLKGEK